MAKNKKGKKFNKQARSVGKAPAASPSAANSTEKLVNPEDRAAGDKTPTAVSPTFQRQQIEEIRQEPKEVTLDPITVKPPEVDSGRGSPESGTAEIEEETPVPSISTDPQLSEAGDNNLKQHKEPLVVPRPATDHVTAKTHTASLPPRDDQVTISKSATVSPEIAQDQARSETVEQQNNARNVSDDSNIAPRLIEPETKAGDGTSISSPAAVAPVNNHLVRSDKRKLPQPLPLARPKHQLEFEWSFWYSDPWMPWESSLVHVHDFAYIEDFWSLFNSLKVPSEVKYSYYLFKKGIRPEWEDPVNESGGKLCLSHGDANPDLLWKELVLLFIGGAALDDLSPHVSGVYLARKKTFAMQVSVWLDTTDRVIVRRVSDVMKSTLQKYLHSTIDMEFATHAKPYSGSKKKSFRHPAHPLHSPRGLSSSTY